MLLLLACFIPRAIAAWNWDILWVDTVHYLHASVALEQSDFKEGFREFGLNVYPLVLLALRHVGIDWQIAGKWFGVLMATLTVVPLWGWVRRIFDDRVALLACMVYALHGKLIVISPLIIRDSLFWFLWVLSIYLIWRSIGEVRIWLFFAAGLALTLTLHTRTEGWLLMVPLGGWTACRLNSATGRRWKLLAGTLLCAAMIPASVALVNVTWLREHPRWEFFRSQHVQMAADWWSAHFHFPLPFAGESRAQNLSPLPRPSVPGARGEGTGDISPVLAAPPSPIVSPPVASSPAKSPATSPLPPKSRVPGKPHAASTAIASLPPAPVHGLNLKLIERLGKGFLWIGSLLAAIGMTFGWKILMRREHLVLFAMNALLLVITRIRYAQAGLDIRYFMPMVIVGTPWMAQGLLCVIAMARWCFERRRPMSPRGFRILSASLILAGVTCSLVDAPMPAAASMRREAMLGQWIGKKFGPEQTLAGNVEPLSLTTYYAQGRVLSLFPARACLDRHLANYLLDLHPDTIVILVDDTIISSDLPIIEENIVDGTGYHRLDAKDLPLDKNEGLLFTR